MIIVDNLIRYDFLKYSNSIIIYNYIARLKWWELTIDDWLTYESMIAFQLFFE